MTASTKRYRVYTQEIWIQPIDVEASSVAEALERIAAEQGTHVHDEYEYSHMRDAATWDVKELSENPNP